MPTFEPLPRFTADIQYLAPAQRRRFRRVALGAFVPGVPELTWSMGTGHRRTRAVPGPIPLPEIRHSVVDVPG